MFQEYKQILVPIDGSLEAELAFRKAIQVAKRNAASLIVAHVIDTRTMQTPTGFEGNFTDEIRRQAEDLLSRYASYAKKLGVDNVKTVIEHGSPKVTITKTLACNHKADIIMIGATGLNAVERLFIGSVSEYVTRNAPCDVLVVRTNLENKEPNGDEEAI